MRGTNDFVFVFPTLLGLLDKTTACDHKINLVLF